MVEQVAATIARYSMLAVGQRVGLAVSGGADSICLLHVMYELAPRWNLRLAVLHFDHQLRGEESRQDALFVRRQAELLGLPCLVETADVRDLADSSGDNLEQAARRARLGFFEKQRRAGVCERIATGHTRSDQAETILLRLLRGAGTAGLAGILPVTPDGRIRPLIHQSRREIELWLRSRGLSWREDASNRDLQFARNRIRHQLLPQLERDWNPALGSVLADMASIAAAEEQFWQDQVDAAWAGVAECRPPCVILRCSVLAGVHPALARRLLRRAIQQVKGDLRSIDASHVESLLGLACELSGTGRLQVPGVDGMRSFDWLRLAPPGLDNLNNRNYALPLSVPGRVTVPQLALSLAVVPSGPLQQCGYTEGVGELDWDRLPAGAWSVRNWRPGDQYQPVGAAQERKLKEMFQDARIPLWERRSWPMVTIGNEIVWARKFGPAARFAAGAGSARRLCIRLEPDESSEPRETS